MTLAEVSDKVTGIWLWWVLNLPFAAVAFALVKKWPRLAAAVLPALAWWAAAGTYDVVWDDPLLGDALWQEQGLPYACAVFGAFASPGSAAVTAVALRTRARRRGRDDRRLGFEPRFRPLPVASNSPPPPRSLD
jgi:hypothetical protein